MFQLQTWMTQIIQSTLSRHSDMGSTLTEAADFLQVHEQLEEDIRVSYLYNFFTEELVFFCELYLIF